MRRVTEAANGPHTTFHFVPPAESSSSTPHDVSKLPGATGTEFRNRGISEGVQLSRLHVVLHLTIPNGRIELCEPLAEARELLGRERLNLVFEFFDFGHGNLTTATSRQATW